MVATPHVTVYEHPARPQQVLVHGCAAHAACSLAAAVARSSQGAINAKGSFTLVLAGGSLPSMLTSLLTYPAPLQWDKFHLFFVDERVVPHASPDSNFHAVQEALLAQTPIPGDQVHAIAEKAANAHAAAAEYAAQLASVPPSVLPHNAAGLPEFDLMLLGMGGDGHIASLFPGHAALREADAWVLPVLDSPKPPPERITMSLPLINAARDVIFVTLGAEKADALLRVLTPSPTGTEALPAQLVELQQGRHVKWFVDQASAARLDLSEWRPKTMQ